ncbi:hypothetical protein WN944_011658 [Citrus x changshan-huyou]|uniref:Uncharacterized protein n=1 Tax=Citrus x changshan-huyou TaxID=2935761 RepID=A0AAP0MTT8_9ROSI
MDLENGLRLLLLLQFFFSHCLTLVVVKRVLQKHVEDKARCLCCLVID